ncbi:MAG: hypothetical protein RL264_2111 [Bacteroidota bacterium]|jgi:hypothetical protein
MPFSKKQRGHTFFLILFFVCLGFTTEVFFTAFYALFENEPIDGKPLSALAGMTYVWMAFIYALIPIIGKLLLHKILPKPIYVRLFIYVSLIYIIEFSAGAFLELLTGSCPWKYTKGWHVMGWIRLDYFPAWTIFAWTIERLYVYIDNKVIK